MLASIQFSLQCFEVHNFFFVKVGSYPSYQILKDLFALQKGCRVLFMILCDETVSMLSTHQNIKC